MSKVTSNVDFKMDDFVYYWMDDGLPCFVADVDNICDIIESLDFSIYYLLASEEKDITPSSTTNTVGTTTHNAKTPPPPPVKTKSTKIFKVVKNYVGRTVTLAKEISSSELAVIQTEAKYNMPLIPYVIVEKLDEFFRLVDAQHGTESIVLLGYDTEKEGPEGWCVLVPDQTNTSVHCNYDPDSIAQIKPDNVLIVGSVHSHPGMAAYASGTDHADQADFDGIHITFGWQKSVNNNATQYHIELQMSGSTFKLNPDDVFEDPHFLKSADPEVVGWTDKVKKVNPPTTGGTKATHTHQPQVSTQAGLAKPNYFPTDLGTHYTNLIKIDEFNMSPDSALILEVKFDKVKSQNICTVCQTPLTPFNLLNGFCGHCDIPVCLDDQDVESILNNLYKYLKARDMATNVQVHIWAFDEDLSEYLMKICNDLSIYYTENEDQLNSIANLTNQDWDYTTFCCNTDISIAYMTCKCEVTAVIEDFHQMISATTNMEIYDFQAACSDCENYYSANCPALRELTLDFVKVNNSVEQIPYFTPISEVGCDSFVHWKTLVTEELIVDNDSPYAGSLLDPVHTHPDDIDYWSPYGSN